jgi:hypothetical protein
MLQFRLHKSCCIFFLMSESLESAFEFLPILAQVINHIQTDTEGINTMKSVISSLLNIDAYFFVR